MDQQAFLVLEQWALHHKITQGEMYKVYEAYYDNLHAKKHPDDSHDLRVLKCCGAFTPSTRLVSMRRGRGWFLGF